MNQDLWLVVTTFLLYMVSMVGIGLWSYYRTQSISDYFLGGRRLGVVPTALSAGASDMSGWLLLGLPGYAYSAGYEVFWLVAGLLVGTLLNWQLVARRLRIYSQLAGDSITIPEYFENRFADKSKLLRLVSACFILIFFLFYTSSGLVAGGKLFATVFEWDYRLAVVIGSLAVVSYTLIGGFLAVSWTDVIQALLMLAALLIVPLLAINLLGGWSQITADIATKNPQLLEVAVATSGEPLSIIVIISLLAWGLGYFGQPHILARFKAIQSADDMPKARTIGVAWSALAMLGAITAGLVAISYFDSPLADSEKVFMLLVEALFHPAVAGVLLAAILAAIMSTADSQLLVSSAALSKDLYLLIAKREASIEQQTLIGRLAVIVIAVIATFIALNPEAKVLDIVSYAWAGFGAAFGPTILLSLYWSRMTRQGALAGVLAGGITVILWKQLSGGLFDLYEIVPGFILSTAAILGVSLLSEEPDESIRRQFEQMTQE